jgi:predicted TIM-barrel fold metal-dependent hydrolase
VLTSQPQFIAEAPTIPGPDPATRRPRVKFPLGACDCHAHVFGPQQQYPFAPNRGYVPPEASTGDYVRMLRAIGCERAVIVHPSVYGMDTR